MGEFLLQIDKSLFTFFNQIFTNSFFDSIMPVITDWNKTWYGWVLFVILWGLLVWKGGRKGRILAFALFVVVAVSDQLSSNFIKKVVMRPRPCHQVNGHTIVEHVRLLVTCGSGFSFPSSHAVNSFAVATFFGVYYKRYAWAYFLYAVIMSYSRVYVGVHYPYDIFVGALVGTVCGLLCVYLLQMTGKYIPRLDIKNLPE